MSLIHEYVAGYGHIPFTCCNDTLCARNAHKNLFLTSVLTAKLLTTYYLRLWGNSSSRSFENVNNVGHTTKLE